MILITLSFVILTLLFPGKIVFIFDLFILCLWYIKWCLSYIIKKLSLKREIVPDYLFIGENAKVELTVKNYSPFPIYLLKIEDLLREEGGLFKTGRGQYFLTLTPGKEVKFDYEVEFRKRGVYFIKRLKLTLFGSLSFLKAERIVDAPCKVVVYPRRFPIERLPLSVRELLPLMRTDYRLLEDLSYIDGVREYTYREPPRRIHWKATAHTGKLLVKTYEHTATTKVHLFTDLNLPGEIFSKKVWSGIRKRYEEYAISASASVVEYMLSEGIPIKLYILGEGDNPWVVEDMNFSDLMEHLAGTKGTDEPTYTIEDVFLSYMEKFTPSSTVIFFSLYLTPKVLPLLIKIKSKVAEVLVLVAPFGFREPDSKRISRNYDIFPREIRALESAASLLREQGIKVELVEPEDALHEVLENV